MTLQDLQIAAAIIWRNWMQSTRIDELPAHCRLNDRAEAYAIQAELARLFGQATIGWKIAATSLAGQAHIGVDGPLAGRLLSQRVREGGANISLPCNFMRWLANELSAFGDGLLAGDEVTTGTCITPARVAPGDQLRVDFGELGLIEATFS